MLANTDVGDGRVVLLVHAGIADRRMWQPQIEHFGDTWRLVVPDLRGFGESGHSSEPYRHAWDLAELLDAQGLSGAIVVGASMGGAASLDLAIERPDLVAGLVLVGSVYDGFQFTEEDLFDRWRELTAVYETGDLNATAEMEADIWLAADTDPNVRHLVEAMIRTSLQYEELDQADVAVRASERFGSIRVPTLVLVGDNDRPDIQRAAKELDTRIETARVETVASASHLPSLEQPESFNQLLTEFLHAHT